MSRPYVSRGRKILQRLCRKLLEESRIEGKGTYRLRLKGSPIEKGNAVKACQIFRNLLKSPPINPRESPQTLRDAVEQLRQTAGDKNLKASIRRQAIVRLLIVEGYPVERFWLTKDATDELLERELGRSIDRPDSMTVNRVRVAARNQALVDIRAAFKEDLSNGCFKTVADVVLRLPETPAPVKPETSLSESNRETLDRAVALFKGGNDGQAETDHGNCRSTPEVRSEVE